MYMSKHLVLCQEWRCCFEFYHFRYFLHKCIEITSQ